MYKRTAARLNLPEQYVKDAVEYFYAHNKKEMYSLSHVIFNISGLGRFIIRPFKFWKREKGLGKLIEAFKERRDNRGIVIKNELEKRHQEMVAITPEVQKLYNYKKKQMYGGA